MHLIKEHFVLIFVTSTLLYLIKFGVKAYLEHKKIKLENKDTFEIMKSNIGFTNVKIKTNEIKVEDIVNGLNNQQRIKDERDAS